MNRTPPRAAGGAGGEVPLRNLPVNPVTPPRGGGGARGVNAFSAAAAAEGTPVRGGAAAVHYGSPKPVAAPPPREPPRMNRRTARYAPLRPGKPVLDTPAIKFTKQGCVEVEGVVAGSTVFVECMDLSRINYDEVRVQALLRAIPSFTEVQFLDGSAPVGVYTFLVITNQAGEEHLVAKQARTVMELGTCHQSIARDGSLGIRDVLCGGELWKKADGLLEFNLLSGDYSWPRLRGLSDENRDITSDEMEVAVRTMLPLAHYNKASTNDTVEQRGSFIQRRNLLPPPDRALLDLYRSVDITVFSFPSRDDCMGFRAANTAERAEERYLFATGGAARAAALGQLKALVTRCNGVEYAPPVAAAAGAGAGAANAPPAAAAPERKTRRHRGQRQRRSLKRSARKSRRN